MGLGVLDILGSISGGLNASRANNQRMAQQRGTAESASEKSRIAQIKQTASLLTGKARIDFMAQHPDVFGGGDVLTNLQKDFKADEEHAEGLSQFKLEQAGMSDIIDKHNALEEGLASGRITAEEGIAIREGLNKQKDEESLTGEARVQSLMDAKPPESLVAPAVAETRYASTAPQTVNFETLNSEARAMLRDDNATTTDLAEVRDKLVRYAGGDVNHPTIKAIEKKIPDTTPIDITEDTSSAEVFQEIRERTGKPINASQITRLSEFDTGIASIPDLITAIDQLGSGGFMDAMGPTAGRIASMNPFDEEGQLLAATFKMTKQLIAKGQEGGVLREGDEIKYDFIVPTQKDMPRIAVQKSINLAKQMKRARAIWLQNIASGLTGDEARVSLDDLDFTIPNKNKLDGGREDVSTELDDIKRRLEVIRREKAQIGSQ